ncbi:MAG: recombination factor protein RarA [Gammaproteobacteria bacterium CG11_big_fil_rev_8_21_14_0_20_46_22]|nr:MAG: recombination factor protein RarA [Gammaproteobacteria bacterium CG12_big_fil_rev_8_21_14_0_65_46_12]PIR12175.1 MAG: recombination factor protein RarA [Gammaproteobacteria bacterium CG11_big_fil_rev_8_21_14_0_20_46_22]
MTAYQPLAARLRPHDLAHYVGQSHLLGEGKPLRKLYEAKQLHSMIFWGPPGSGKTTLATMLAEQADLAFETLSAVLAGVKEIRAIAQAAKNRHAMTGKATVLFVDEVHRFNKAQQDAFLPYVEEGSLIFIGATTENPSFELNNALLSRARVYVLKMLSEDELLHVLHHALNDKQNGLGELKLSIDEKAQAVLIDAASGDARRLLNFLEMAGDIAEQGHITLGIVQEVMGETYTRFDNKGEAFYDLMSALHKSVRGSAPDAALYWFARMLVGGCDPLYIARRVVRMASEDIGNADPRALTIALNAWQVQERLGSPEGELAIAQAVVYMSVAAKSNAVYTAYNAAIEAAKSHGALEVPLHIRNAPTKLMKSLDYGKAYRYAHDEPHAYAAGESYLPDEINDLSLYHPTDRGLEKKIGEKLAFLRGLDADA